MEGKQQIEVCFSPAIFHLHHDPESVVVIIDILRATSAICTAFMNGVDSIIPVGKIEEAKAYKEKGFMVAAERDGLVLDFADFGNSPFNFTVERVKGKEIVYSTTNGTQAVQMASDCHAVTVGSYLNLSALAKYLIDTRRNVVMFCAGWKKRFSLEDTLFAGALSELLLDSGKFSTICDATHASVDLWRTAKPDLYGYIPKMAQKNRLAKHGLDDCIEFCHTLNQTGVIPILKNNKLVPLDTNEQTAHATNY
ncbi:MAG: 2-phosphosulfolactate phosphatase [Breznakibacter sp.]